MTGPFVRRFVTAILLTPHLGTQEKNEKGYNRLRVFVLLSLLNNKIETPEGHSATSIISILQNGRDDPDLIEKSRFQLPFITQKGQG